MKELAYKGDDEIVCVYIDIKTAISKLPLLYRNAIVKGLIYDDSHISEELIDKSLEFMEDILNGR